MKSAAKFILALASALLLAWGVRTFAFTIFSVPRGGLPPQLRAGDRVMVNRMDCDSFARGDVVVFADSAVQRHRLATSAEAYYIGRIERLPGDTLLLDTLRYVIPTVCCKRCGCKDCRFYLVRTATGRQLVHKHQMIGRASKLF